MDPRATKLAKILVDYSTKVQKGDNVIIDASDLTAQDLIHECYRLSIERGANVYLDITGVNYEITRADVGGFMKTFLTSASEEQLQVPREIMEKKLEWMDKIIRITTIHNKNFLADIDPHKLRLYGKTYYPTFEKMMDKDWVLTYVPTSGSAQDAGMSLEQFWDFYYQACTVDYEKQGQKIKKLVDILDQGSEVHIVAKDTDLKISIEDRLAAGATSGINNIPDGECFAAPIEDFTSGHISFDYPQNRDGTEISNISLQFKDGKVIDFDATSGKELLEEIFAEHEGNKRLGEVGIGMNPGITKYIKNTIFDEKIMGTMHFALGKSYDEERGGGKNDGTIHWDLVKDLREEGSLVTVDGKPIIKNGELVI